MKNRKDRKIRKEGRCYLCDRRDGKANYVSIADANAGVFGMWASGKITTSEMKDMNIYECPHDKFFHVGHNTYYEIAKQSMSHLRGMDVQNRSVA